VSIAVAQLRRRPRVGRLVDLLQPQEERLCAPQNNHRIISVLDALTIRDRDPDLPADRQRDQLCLHRQEHADRFR
jgi:hypothetical protein